MLLFAVGKKVVEEEAVFVCFWRDFGGRHHTISVLHRDILNGSVLFGTQLMSLPLKDALGH